MCVYPLGTYVCLSTRHICVFAHSPHMGAYPLATYVCLSTPHIWVSIHSLHMCVCLFATYVCMYQVGVLDFYCHMVIIFLHGFNDMNTTFTIVTYVCLSQVRSWISNVIWFGSFLCSMI